MTAIKLLETIKRQVSVSGSHVKISKTVILSVHVVAEESLTEVALSQFRGSASAFGENSTLIHNDFASQQSTCSSETFDSSVR